MSYSRPSYEELKARIEVDLAVVPAVLRGPLSAAWARACSAQHGHLDWIDAQCSPMTCELERLYDWAVLYDVPRLPAQRATGAISVSGTAGASVLKDALWRAANGLDYAVTEAVALAGEAGRVQVRCVTPGVAGNLTAGQALSLVDPIIGVVGTATVAGSGLTGGAEIEGVDDWRIRVTDEWQTMVVSGGRSGKDEDYRYWAMSAHPSVTGALVQKHVLGVGTVLVRPICTGLAHRLPTQGVLDAVASYIAAHAPACADTRVATPMLRAVPVELRLAASVDSAINRLAIQSALLSAVQAETSETAVLSLAEIDSAVGSVTSQYTRRAPVASIAVSPGEILDTPLVVWF